MKLNIKLAMLLLTSGLSYGAVFDLTALNTAGIPVALNTPITFAISPTVNVDITIGGAGVNALNAGVGSSPGSAQLQSGEVVTFTFSNFSSSNPNETLVNYTVEGLYTSDDQGFTFGSASGDALDIGVLGAPGTESFVDSSLTPLATPVLAFVGPNAFAPISNDLAFTTGFEVSPSAGTFRLQGFEITVDTTIPEPTSAALLGLGGLALIARRKRA